MLAGPPLVRRSEVRNLLLTGPIGNLGNVAIPGDAGAAD